MNALHLPVRDMAFGIALGFGVLSANDFIQALLLTTHTSLTDPIQFVVESVILAALGIWVAYAALPEPARQPVVMPANSTIYRWNEIASALGHTGTQVAVQQSTDAFFLNDVESVVERVLSRNLKKKESES
jgi:cyanate lyase